MIRIKEVERVDELPTAESGRAFFRTPLVQDVSDTLTTQWRQTVFPSMKTWGYAVNLLWLEYVAHPCVEYLRSLVLMAGRAIELTLGRRHPKTSEAFRKTCGLSLQSAMAGRPPQTASAHPWGTILQEAHETSLEERARLPEKTGVTVTSSLALLPEKKGVSPEAFDEIRGLDDIFTSPVPALFGEGGKPSRRVELIAAPKPAPRPSIDERPLVASMGMTPPTPRPSMYERPLVASMGMTPPMIQPAKQPSIQVGGESPSIPPTTSFVSETVSREESSNAAKPISKIKNDSAPFQFDESIRRKVRWPDGPAMTPPRANQSDQKAADSPAINPAGQAIPARPLKDSKAPPRPAAFRAGEAFPEYEYLDARDATDLSGFQYILHSNRMLSDSISSLVDRYFQKSEQEGI